MLTPEKKDSTKDNNKKVKLLNKTRAYTRKEKSTTKYEKQKSHSSTITTRQGPSTSYQKRRKIKNNTVCTYLGRPSERPPSADSHELPTLLSTPKQPGGRWVQTTGLIKGAVGVLCGDREAAHAATNCSKGTTSHKQCPNRPLLVVSAQPNT